MQEDRRLVLLRALKEMSGYSANESILDTCLERYGHRISRDVVRTELKWLEEQSLLTIEDVAGCYVVTLNARGEEVAQGISTVPGIKKPRAGL